MMITLIGGLFLVAGTLTWAVAVTDTSKDTRYIEALEVVGYGSAISGLFMLMTGLAQ